MSASFGTKTILVEFFYTPSIVVAISALFIDKNSDYFLLVLRNDKVVEAGVNLH